MMKKTSLKSSRSSVQDIRSSSKYTHGFNKQRTMYDGVVKHGNAEITTDVFTFRELAAATQNFHPEMLVGEGGFGRVYKGQLKQQNQIVAVKQLDQNGVQGNREFLDAVVALSHIQHPNLVNLIGYCADGRQKILVYEYMSNDSLENHLFDVSAERGPLDWYTRMKVAKGTAQGLEYLHDTANPPIVYHDFKASNILLDDEFNPKLSDFGLTKLGPDGENDRVSMMVTYGYCAPEYAQTGEPTSKSNVYSFGVVLLEILSGRRAIDTTRPTEEQNLVTWAQPIFKDRKKFRLMADPLLEDKYPVKGLYQAIAIAAMCLQEESSTRPLIADVATTLEYLLNENFENNDIINSPDDELAEELEIGDDATS